MPTLELHLQEQRFGLGQGQAELLQSRVAPTPIHICPAMSVLSAGSHSEG